MSLAGKFHVEVALRAYAMARGVSPVKAAALADKFWERYGGWCPETEADLVPVWHWLDAECKYRSSSLSD